MAFVGIPRQHGRTAFSDWLKGVAASALDLAASGTAAVRSLGDQENTSIRVILLPLGSATPLLDVLVSQDLSIAGWANFQTGFACCARLPFGPDVPWLDFLNRVSHVGAIMNDRSIPSTFRVCPVAGF